MFRVTMIHAWWGTPFLKAKFPNSMNALSQSNKTDHLFREHWPCVFMAHDFAVLGQKASTGIVYIRGKMDFLLWVPAVERDDCVSWKINLAAEGNSLRRRISMKMHFSDFPPSACWSVRASVWLHMLVHSDEDYSCWSCWINWRFVTVVYEKFVANKVAELPRSNDYTNFHGELVFINCIDISVQPGWLEGDTMGIWPLSQ